MCDLKVHGTYPFDRKGWVTLKGGWDQPPFELRDAMELLGVTPEQLYKRQVEDIALGRYVYLFLNKGYVLLGNQEDVLGLDGLGASLAGSWDQRSRTSLPVVGTQAVYLHDGRYSLIEYQG